MFVALKNLVVNSEFLFVASEIGSHFVAQVCFEFMAIALSQHSKSWDYRHKPPHLKRGHGKEQKAMEEALTGEPSGTETTSC